MKLSYNSYFLNLDTVGMQRFAIIWNAGINLRLESIVNGVDSGENCCAEFSNFQKCAIVRRVEIVMSPIHFRWRIISGWELFVSKIKVLR